jgi:hypothetical protein
MATIAFRQRSTRPIRRPAASHLFAVGQPVRFKNGLGGLAVPVEIFQVTATLPALGNALQYRVRGNEQGRERVTTEDNLDPVLAPSAGQGGTLIQRTFGNG